MATINWSALAQGQTIAFDPGADVLRFDDPALAAGRVRVSGVGDPAVGPTVLTAGGITVTLQVALSTLSSTNVTFADGSLLRVGTAAGEFVTGGGRDDLLVALGGNDVLQGGDGIDTALFLGAIAGYSFGTFGGALVVHDIDAALLDEGMNTVAGVERLQFADAMLTVGAAGEVRVNSFTVGHQQAPAIAALASGGFVVAWQSSGQDGSERGVYAQRHDSAGATVGAEFRVNTFTPGHQDSPSVAALGDGGFVLAWQSAAQDGSGYGVHAQRYDAAGTPLGAEFRVNAFTASDQLDPSVAALADGGFVVAWRSTGQDGSGTSVHAQRYDASGQPAGAEFRVNTFSAGNQGDPVVAALPGGGFVVAWSSNGQDGSGEGVYAQRHDAAGLAQGAEFRVNTTTAQDQRDPAVAALADGGFIVAWLLYRPDTSPFGGGAGLAIHAQRYDATGVPQGGEFLVDSYTDLALASPAVAGFAGGGFVVSWSSFDRDGDGYGVFARRFDAAGVAAGATSRVNVATANQQLSPALAALDDGGFVVTWESLAQDGSGYGVYARRYTASGEPLGGSLAGDGGDNVLRWSSAEPVLLDGGGGSDQLQGGSGADRLLGGDGDDTLDGGGGADMLVGGEGSDLYVVDAAGDIVIDSGGIADRVRSGVDFILPPGVEHLELSGAAINGIGNAQANVLLGNALANTLIGGGGDDTIDGAGGNDTLGGGDGNDTLQGEAGEDQLYGERGDDWLFGGDDYDLIFGGEGNDLVMGQGGGDIVFAQSGNDLVDGGEGTDVLFGQEDNDVLFGDAADDQLIGGAGNDTLMGERGGLSLTGGNDWIYGDTEVLSLDGGDDLINGGGGNDVIVGGGGNDVIDGGHGNDIVEGNAGADILVGSAASIVGPETIGSDLFIYREMTDAGDSIYGFDTRPGDNDGIDLRPLFDALGYAGMDPRGDGWLRIEQSGADARVQVDVDGAANGANFSTLVTLVDRQAGDIVDGFFL